MGFTNKADGLEESISGFLKLWKFLEKNGKKFNNMWLLEVLPKPDHMRRSSSVNLKNELSLLKSFYKDLTFQNFAHNSVTTTL